MNPNIATSLKTIADALNTQKAIQDFVRAFEAAMDALLKLKAENEQDRSDLRKMTDAALTQIKDAISRIRNGSDYVLTTSDKEEIADLITVPIVEKETIVKEQPIVRETIREIPNKDSAEDIRNKLELLEGPERLSISAIHNLAEELQALKKTKSAPTVVQGGIIGRSLIRDVDLSSQLNGSTKTFNIEAVFSIITVDLSSFPHALRKNVDYSYTPTSITFSDEIDAAASLAAGQTCILTVVSA